MFVNSKLKFNGMNGVEGKFKNCTLRQARRDAARKILANVFATRRTQLTMMPAMGMIQTRRPPEENHPVFLTRRKVQGRFSTPPYPRARRADRAGASHPLPTIQRGPPDAGANTN